MLLERLYDDDLAQASYLVGCQASQELLVVDPLRDPNRYLEAARRNGMRITAVTETHVHADFLSGARELAAATGAKLYLSAEGTGGWHYRMGGDRLNDGDTLRLGNVTVEALHTPGHTPEHLSFLVTDGASATAPGYLLSGDFVFVGDVGRPDLLDEAAGGDDTRFEGARRLFASLRDRFLRLGEYVQVFPGHGAGSACGKSMGAMPSTTVGYERRFAWWSRFLELGDEEGFVAALLEGQPDVPSYFGRMKTQNLEGPALLGERPELPRLEPAEVAPRLPAEAILVDTRPSARFHADAVVGSRNVPSGQRFTTYASYALGPEAGAERPLILLAADADHAESLRLKLALVGVDDVNGYVTSLEGFERRPPGRVSTAGLATLADPFVLDVRGRAEFEAGHIPGAHHVFVGRLGSRLDELPRDRPLVVHCQGGGRAAVAEGILLDHGFDNVLDLEGSYSAWRDAFGRDPATVEG
jgi:hydroxyacylglutathione hydrolase